MESSLSVLAVLGDEESIRSGHEYVHEHVCGFSSGTRRSSVSALRAARSSSLGWRRLSTRQPHSESRTSSSAWCASKAHAPRKRSFQVVKHYTDCRGECSVVQMTNHEQLC
eukprot:5014228-Pleurochrysis_carterae.AAC.1